MAGQPCPKAGDTLSGRRPLLKGFFPFDTLVLCVHVSQVVVSQSLHRFVDGRGDDDLHDIAVLGRVHLHLGGGGCRRPYPRSARAPHQDGGRS